MARVGEPSVQTGPANDEAALVESALHLDGAGLPVAGANVYIAGHRIGFSHLLGRRRRLELSNNPNSRTLNDDDVRYPPEDLPGFIYGQ